ncbi:MAG: C45 family peptidase [Solirubrobacteraceae bacterium]
MTDEIATTRSQLGGLRYLVLRGSRRAAFRALGEQAAADIREAIRGLPKMRALRRYASSLHGAKHIEAVKAATVHAHPDAVEDVSQMAAGAKVSADDLFLLNLRGDLGDLDADGCTDIVYRTVHTVLGHNEDGDPLFKRRITLLVLHLHDQPPTATLWYPGLLPFNSFTITPSLAWGIDHLPVGQPPVAPGRQFVARTLPTATSLDGAVEFLRSHPSAGGFAYTIIELANSRTAVVEAAAGQFAAAELPQHTPTFSWHTNHARQLSEDVAGPASESSLRRGERLNTMQHDGSELSEDSLLKLLRSPWPHGVLQQGSATTLATAIVNASTRAITLTNDNTVPTTLQIADLFRCSAAPR